jgi:hypothetical protein
MDSDSNEVADCGDEYPQDFPITSTNAPPRPRKKVPSLCGCRIVDSDSDFGNDGVLECLTIIEKTVPGLCGC